MSKVRKIIKVGIVYEFHTYIHAWNTVQKDQRNPMSKVSKIHCTDFNALNGMYVGDVEDGICGFYASLYAEYRFMSKMSKILCIQWPLAPPGGKARCSRPSCGFSGSPPCSPRRQLCKLSWTCHTTRVIAGKTYSQSPILKTKGRSATR